MLYNLWFFCSMSFRISGHQKIFASDSIFVVPESPKYKMSISLHLRSIGTAIWSSTKTRPHQMKSFSKPVYNHRRCVSFFAPHTCTDSCHFRINCRHWDRVFKSSMKLNSAFFCWNVFIVCDWFVLLLLNFISVPLSLLFGFFCSWIWLAVE